MVNANDAVGWTAANTQEALSDPVTPLTWTFLVPFIERGRRELFTAAGFDEIDGAYLRLIAGRAYFNPDYFRSFLAQLPGVPTDIFDALIFGEGRPEVDFLLPEWTPRTLRAALLLAAARLGADPDALARSAARADEAMRRLGRHGPRGLSGPALLARVDAIMPEVERVLRLHVLATALAGASYLLLDIALRAFGVGHARNLPARIVAGARPSAQSLCNARLWEILDSPPGAGREEALDRFLERFGHRSEKEAELAAPRWSEDPTFVRRMVEEASAARRSVHPLRRERKVRHRARALERAVGREIARRGGPLERLVPARRFLYRWLAREARAYAPYREDMKFRALRGLAMVRETFLVLGERLTVAGAIGAPEDVFFLEAAEARAAVADLDRRRGEVGAGLADRIIDRRARHEAFCRVEPPRRVVAGGTPETLYLWDDARVSAGVLGSEAPAPSVGGGGTIEGVAASAGVVRARARVLSSPDDGTRLLQGEIVVARALNAGWTPLFLAAGGAVSDLGGVLSHAAIVARELGVPLVTAARDATRRIRDGDLVEVDGDRGVVRVIESARG